MRPAPPSRPNPAATSRRGASAVAAPGWPTWNAARTGRRSGPGSNCRRTPFGFLRAVLLFSAGVPGSSSACEAAGDEVGQAPGDAVVGGEPGVEDGDLQSACSVAGEQAAEDVCGLLPGKAAWVAVVHGRHQGVIKDVDVQMHPEPVESGLGERSQGLAKSMTGAAGPDLCGVNDSDGRAADVLAEEMVVVVNGPVADQRHIFVPHKRAQPVQVG